MPLLPPHLADDQEQEHEQKRLADASKIGKQGPSKYGPGGRKAYKAKARKKRK